VIRSSTNPLAMSVRPEVELLLCCARPGADPARAERIRVLIQEGVDWDRLLRLARQHSVMPLLYQRLSAACPESVPQGLLDRLRGRFQANARRNVFLTKELLRLLSLLEAHGIPAIPLKGPTLAVSAYGDLALRQFSDLDILVPRQDVASAGDLLIAQGYHPRDHQTDAQKIAALQVRFHRQFVRSDEALVELHWGLIDWQFSFSFDLDRVWERFETISLLGTEVRSLSPEDLLLFLCVHAAKPGHRWRRLGWICDVAGLLHAHPGLDWGRVMAEAQRLGSERRLLLGLRLAGDLLGTLLPEPVRGRMQSDPVVQMLAAQVCGRLGGSTDNRHTLEGPRFDLQVMERRRDRARFLLRSALTSTAIKWALRSPVGLLIRPYRLLERVPSRNVWLWPLPLFALLSYVYHLLLPVRLAARAVRSAWFRMLSHAACTSASSSGRSGTSP